MAWNRGPANDFGIPGEPLRHVIGELRQKCSIDKKKVDRLHPFQKLVLFWIQVKTAFSEDSCIIFINKF
jgi:hypothetical protein